MNMTFELSSAAGRTSDRQIDESIYQAHHGFGYGVLSYGLITQKIY